MFRMLADVDLSEDHDKDRATEAGAVSFFNIEALGDILAIHSIRFKKMCTRDL